MIVMKNKKWIIVLAIISLGVILAFFFFWNASGDNIRPGVTGPGKTPDLKAVKTVKAELSRVTEWYDAVGTVQPRTQARIESQVAGQVNDVRVNAGDEIVNGQLLVVVDDRQMQARLSQAMQSLKSSVSQKEQARQAVNAAEAAFNEADSSYKRVKKFFEADAATKQDLEQAHSRYLQAQAAMKRSEDGLSGASAGVRMAEEMVQEAQIGLGYTKIKAPSDGKVLQRLVDPGDLAMPGKPLLLLRTTGGLRLEAYVRESLIREVHPGITLRVELTTLKQRVEAQVEELIPYADPLTRTFLVKATLPDIAGLYPGMYGKLLIPYKEADIVLIPKDTVDQVGQMELVMVRTADKWVRRYIKTGKDYGDKVEVLSGLSGNETLRVKESGNDA